MKLSEYIKHLQEILDTCGDLPCICRNDEQANSYYDLWNKPSVKYVIEMIHPDEIEAYCDLRKVCLVN